MELEKRQELLSKCKEKLSILSNNDRSKNDMNVFFKLYSKFLFERATIDWKTWKLPSEDRFINSDDLEDVNFTEAQKLLEKLAIVRLNGGLGTTMGCSGPKSLIKIKNDKSFLEISIDQIVALNQKYNVQIPLLLMESFNTVDETKNELENLTKNKNIEIIQFEQAKCPRIYAETLLPVPESLNSENETWYPPGHGNIFETLESTGLANKLLKQGKTVLFVSNIDNTCAIVDPKFIKALLNKEHEYIMEITDKTVADVKGGTLIEIDGRLMHLEMPQVPSEGIDEFCSTKTFKNFNTNNIWIDLKAIKPRLNEIQREIIANHKTLPDGQKVIQLETSIGGAIRNFERACGLRVDRSRFLPVKRTQDLLIVSSDLFDLDKESNVHLIKSRKSLPVYSLSEEFNNLDDFQKRFETIPSLKNVENLKIQGDVWFGKNIVLKGKVEIIAQKGETLKIPDNSVIENLAD